MKRGLLVTVYDEATTKAAIAGGVDAVLLPLKEQHEHLLPLLLLHDVEVFVDICGMRDEDYHDKKKLLKQWLDMGVKGICTGSLTLSSKFSSAGFITLLNLGSQLLTRESLKYVQSTHIIVSPEIAHKELNELLTAERFRFVITMHTNMKYYLHSRIRHNLPVHYYRDHDRTLGVERGTLRNIPDLYSVSFHQHINALTHDSIDYMLIADTTRKPYEQFVLVDSYRKLMDNKASKDTVERIELIARGKISDGMFSHHVPDLRQKKGIYLGVIGESGLTLQAELKKGDQILIMTNKKPATYKLNFFICDKHKVTRAQKDDTIQLNIPHFTAGNKVYKIAESEEEIDVKRLPVDMHLQGRAGEHLQVVLSFNGVQVTSETAGVLVPAKNNPITKDTLAEHIKFTDHPFYVNAWDSSVETGQYVSFTELKYAIRKAADDLILKVVKERAVSVTLPDIPLVESFRNNEIARPKLYVHVKNVDEVMQAVQLKVDCIYYDIYQPDILDVKDICGKHHIPLYLRTPNIVGPNEYRHVMKLIEHYQPDGILVANLAFLDMNGLAKHLDILMPSLPKEMLRISAPDIDLDHTIAQVTGKQVLMACRLPIDAKRKEKGFIFTKSPFGETLILDRVSINHGEVVLKLVSKGQSNFFIDVRTNTKDMVSSVKEEIYNAIEQFGMVISH
ncbi:DUF3656 domain-containing protein [Candidatus Woesearchaeota archaeon]|nr:DUF3656 domain-containing protein [Candidatus Woesearchaeota archaeon]